jgi:hypothetical protein
MWCSRTEAEIHREPIIVFKFFAEISISAVMIFGSENAIGSLGGNWENIGEFTIHTKNLQNEVELCGTVYEYG